jgi:hypothetical protein
VTAETARSARLRNKTAAPAVEPTSSSLHHRSVSTSPSPGPPGAPEFWCYKRGVLVLRLQAVPGPFVPTKGAVSPLDDKDGLMRPCSFASGQFLSTEWEPRVRLLLERACDLVDFIELLEDRRYEVEADPPSLRKRPFRQL